MSKRWYVVLEFGAPGLGEANKVADAIASLCAAEFETVRRAAFNVPSEGMYVIDEASDVPAPSESL